MGISIIENFVKPSVDSVQVNLGTEINI